MMNHCTKSPCGIATGGMCYDRDCPYRHTPGPTYHPGPSFQPQGPIPQTRGCICPPTSEQTCEAPYCPRKNLLKPAVIEVAELQPDEDCPGLWIGFKTAADRDKALKLFKAPA